MTKIKEMINSVRFQQAFLVLILQILAYYHILPQEIINYISVFFGVSITLRTIDK
jgi:hypothetical protein